MGWKSFSIGAVAGVAACAGVLYSQPKSKIPDDQGIAFADREFYVSGDPHEGYGGFAHIAGTIAGGDLPKNNTVTVDCFRNEKRCEMAYVAQIGQSQADDITITEFEITEWGPNMIAAKNEELCSNETVNISAGIKHAEFVIVPINQDKPVCEHADANVRKMTLERSLFWQRVDPENSAGS